VENVRAAAGRIWARPLHRYYTDHTVTHSERVIALLDGLTAGMMVTEKHLSPTEVWVLLAAAYLHDVGMQNERFAGGDVEEIRACHHEQTARMIYAVFEDPANAFPILLTGDPALVEAVALVAKGHRRVDLAGAEYEPLAHGGETLRLRLLAALLRLADELDVDHRRVDLEQMKLLALPVESQLHWWKCHYVAGVSIADGYIRVGYRFPQERPDYEGFIVPLVEGEIRGKLADLEEILWTHGVKVALGKPQVRLMRLVQPLPPEVEALARREAEGGVRASGHQAGAAGRSPVSPAPRRVQVEAAPADTLSGPGALAQDGSVAAGAGGVAVGRDVQGDVVTGTKTTIFDQRGQTVGAQINVAGDYVAQRPTGGAGDAGAPTESAALLERQLAEAEANLALIRERKVEYVLQVDVPLQLVKEERRLLERIAELKAELGDLI
jgi:hypothetical protein